MVNLRQFNFITKLFGEEVPSVGCNAGPCDDPTAQNICDISDTAECSNGGVDWCNTDNAGCYSGAFDWCGWDNDSCVGPTTDICRCDAFVG